MQTNILRENTDTVAHGIIDRLESLEARTKKSESQKAIETAGRAFVHAKELLKKFDFKNASSQEIAQMTNAWIAWKDDGIFKDEKFKDLRGELQGMLVEGKKEFKYVRQIWRTDIVKFVLDQIGDRKDKADITEAIMAAQKVHESPRKAISSVKLEGVNKDDLATKMEAGKSTDFSGIEKTFGKEPKEILVVTGGAFLNIPLEYAAKFKFKNMVEEGGKIYAQMENGCEGNFVIIENAEKTSGKKRKEKTDDGAPSLPKYTTEHDAPPTIPKERVRIRREDDSNNEYGEGSGGGGGVLGDIHRDEEAEAAKREKARRDAEARKQAEETARQQEAARVQAEEAARLAREQQQQSPEEKERAEAIAKGIPFMTKKEATDSGLVVCTDKCRAKEGYVFVDVNAMFNFAVKKKEEAQRAAPQDDANGLAAAERAREAAEKQEEAERAKRQAESAEVGSDMGTELKKLGFVDAGKSKYNGTDSSSYVNGKMRIWFYPEEQTGIYSWGLSENTSFKGNDDLLVVTHYGKGTVPEVVNKLKDAIREAEKNNAARDSLDKWSDKIFKQSGVTVSAHTPPGRPFDAKFEEINNNMAKIAEKIAVIENLYPGKLRELNAKKKYSAAIYITSNEDYSYPKDVAESYVFVGYKDPARAYDIIVEYLNYLKLITDEDVRGAQDKKGRAEELAKKHVERGQQEEQNEGGINAKELIDARKKDAIAFFSRLGFKHSYTYQNENDCFFEGKHSKIELNMEFDTTANQYVSKLRPNKWRDKYEEITDSNFNNLLNTLEKRTNETETVGRIEDNYGISVEHGKNEKWDYLKEQTDKSIMPALEKIEEEFPGLMAIVKERGIKFKLAKLRAAEGFNVGTTKISDDKKTLTIDWSASPNELKEGILKQLNPTIVMYDYVNRKLEDIGNTFYGVSVLEFYGVKYDQLAVAKALKDIRGAIGVVNAKYPGLLEQMKKDGIRIILAEDDFWDDERVITDKGRKDIEIDWNDGSEKIEKRIMEGLKELNFDYSKFLRKAPPSEQVEVPK